MSAPSPTQSTMGPIIEINKPRAGDFLKDTIDFQAQITSPSSVSEINVYFNNQLIQKFSRNFGMSYVFSWQFSPPKIDSQNLLEIEAVTENLQKNKVGVIVYK